MIGDYNILNDDAINHIFFDVLLKLDFRSYSSAAFNCYEAFFLFLNKKYQTIKFEHHGQYKVLTFDLIGLEFLWELFLQSTDSKVTSKASGLLIRIIKNSKVVTENLLQEVQQIPEIQNDLSPLELAQNHFVELTMKNVLQGCQRVKEQQLIEDAYQDVSPQDQNRISRSIDFLVKLIEEFDGLNNSKGKAAQGDVTEQVILTVDNRLPDAIPPKKFSITVSKSMSIGDLRKLVGGKLNPPLASNELMMITKGSILDNDKVTVANKKMQNSQTIMCMKSKPVDTFMDIDATKAAEPEVEISDVLLSQKIEELQCIFPDLDAPLLKFVLKKKNYNTEDVAGALLDPTNTVTFREEMEQAEILEAQKNANSNNGNQSSGQKGEQRSLSGMITNRSEYFGLFFQILKLPNAELQNKVWNLLSNLPLNAGLYNHIRSIFEENPTYEIRWEDILDNDNPAKLLYTLQIMETFITCTNLDEKEQGIEVSFLCHWVFL